MNAKLIKRNGVTLVEINGEACEFAGYRSWRPDDKYIKGFSDVGIPFMTVLPSGIKNSFGLPYSAYGDFWLGDGVYDWDNLRRQLKQITDNAPGAHIALNLMLDTRDWFLKEHPEVLNSFIYFTSVCTYEPWRVCAERMICDTIDFVEREFPELVFAVILSAGGTCEWHNKSNELPENELRKELYRKWLSDENAEIPDKPEIYKSSHGIFRDKSKNKSAIDFLNFTNDSITETVKYFASVVKKHTLSRLLVGVPAGYILVGDDGMSGHSGSCDILKIPEVDMIICPASYHHRGRASVSCSQAAMDSVRLNGKLMVHSIDNASFAVNGNPYVQLLQKSHSKHESMYESINYMRRETALAMSKGAGYWIFDMLGGWYPDKESQSAVGETIAAYRKINSAPVLYNAEVAMLVDTKSLITLVNDKLRRELITEQITELGRAGCAVDYLSLYDILLRDFPADQYKLYILPDAFDPSPEIRLAIESLREKGASFIFSFAAGAVTDSGFSLSDASRFCGIDLKEDDTVDICTVVDSAYTDIGSPKIYGDARANPITPLLTVNDNDAEIMGKSLMYGKARLAIKKRDRGFDLWSYRGAIPECVLRPLIKNAGVFIYQTDSLPTYANSRMVAFFDAEGGTHKIKFPHRGEIVDFYTGEKIIYNGGYADIYFNKCECKLFIYN